MAFGNILKNLRKENGLTIDGLAKQLDTSRQSIMDYESNKSTPKIETLKKISECFNVSIDYLIYGDKYDYTEKIDPNNITTVLRAIGSMLNNGILEFPKAESHNGIDSLCIKNDILKCYLLDYMKMQKRLSDYQNIEEKNKILLLLSDKY